MARNAEALSSSLVYLKSNVQRSFGHRDTQHPTTAECSQGVRSLFKAKAEWEFMQLASVFSSIKWGVAQIPLGSYEDERPSQFGTWEIMGPFIIFYHIH